jgi:DNA polymerase-1
MQGLDIETANPNGGGELEPTKGYVRLVQIADSDGTADVYGGKHPDVPGRIATLSEAVAHNAPFERTWIDEHYDIDIGVIHDTMVMSRVLYGGTDSSRSPRFSHRLEAVTKRELGRTLDKAEQEADWNGTLTREMLAYAARDAAVLRPLSEALLEKIEDAGLREVYELERRTSHAVDAMERNGFGIDEGRLHSFIEGTREEAKQLKAELEKAWGINPGSSKQLREHFGLEAREDWPTTKGGAPKTDQEALKALEDEEPMIRLWLHWKRVEKMRSTYGESLRKRIVDGRIHGRFYQFGTATGRFSSAKPNLQNIPRDAAVRAMFWAGSEDRRLITADYASIEVWVAAILWKDTRMQQVLAHGQNIHKATAAALLRKPYADITDEEKQIGKTTNFALLYGAGPNRLMAQFHKEGLSIGEDEAVSLFKRFFDTYRGFKRRRYALADAFREGRLPETRTAIGRRRNDTNRWHGPFLNHEVQGTAADGLKTALALLHEDDRFPTAKLVATVHDEIIVECDAHEAEEVRDWVVDRMVTGMKEALPGYHLPSDPKVEATIDTVWTK